MTEAFGIVDPEDVEQEPFPESGTLHRKLTAALGCTDVRINTVTLGPGAATAAHSHERQEEVYVALDGGQVRIDESVFDVPAGGVVRVGPDPVRSVHNPADGTTRTWVMIGAPPVGSVGDFGEYVVPEDER